MKLSELFEGAPDIEVEGLTSDSRLQVKNGLFFCVKGMTADGHHFIQQAKSNGCIAIVHTDPIDNIDPELTYIKVKDTYEVLNLVASRFYGNVTQKMVMFGVTGTNGKSTITTLIRNILDPSIPCGYIGTIGKMYGDVVLPETYTTPDVIELQGVLHDMYNHGMKAVSMEVSSAGLMMHRVDAVDFDYTIYTNLTHDHLDLHGNMENYFEAKHSLFTRLSERKVAIFNVDDPYGTRMMEDVVAHKITYAIHQEADYRATDVTLYANHTTFNLVHEGNVYSFDTNLVAEFNVYNLLATIAALHEYGVTMEDLQAYAMNLPQVLGRMERVDVGQPFHVIVDYAHTPDGFEKIFRYAKAITPTKNRLIAVFGSAGKRDRKKRKTMGILADECCDLIILTEEDPRTENAKDIADEIQTGIIQHTCMFIDSRYDAIRQAIELANDNDTIVILGKGDEDFMDYANGREFWMGDQNAARDAIQKYYLGEGDENYEEE